MVNITDAIEYIETNVIDIEDFTEADEAKQLRILNVAQSTLTTKFSSYTIPDASVYEYANELAIAFNDTNRLNNQGVASYSITGVASYNFKETMKRDLDAFIPKKSLDLINAEPANAELPSVGLRGMKDVIL
jgi:maltoporin